jgi:hypothetical protein
MKDVVRGSTTSMGIRPLLGLLVMTALVFGLVGCGGGQDATTTLGNTTETTQAEPTTVPTAVPATVATTVVESTTTTEPPLVGSYSGEYEYEEPDIAGHFPVDFHIQADGTLEGVGEIYDGTVFAVYGEVAADGSFVADGDVKGAGMKVTFRGSFSSSEGGVTAEGTWEGEGGFAGTWTATKD